jgi:hypothetical protein
MIQCLRMPYFQVLHHVEPVDYISVFEEDPNRGQILMKIRLIIIQLMVLVELVEHLKKKIAVFLVAFTDNKNVLKAFKSLYISFDNTSYYRISIGDVKAHIRLTNNVNRVLFVQLRR